MIQYRLQWFDEIDSTNTYLVQKAREGEAEGLVILSKCQRQGKGRRGRSFFSPKESGLYMSVLVRPQANPLRPGILTLMAGLAGARAVDCLRLGCEIKWVNDLILQGRKIGGILVEGGTDTHDEPFAVVGIGFNLWPPEEGMPEELSGVAGTIFDSAPAEGREAVFEALAHAFLQAFEALYRHYPDTGFIQDYKARCLVIGRRVRLRDPYHQALDEVLTVTDIGPQGELVGLDSKRVERRYENGEISIILEE